MFFGCIYKEWFRYHDEEKPDIKFGHFFASPVRIADDGPKTIPEMLEAHKAFCLRASSLLHQIYIGEASESWMGPWPSPQHYSVLPLCQVIIVVLDSGAELALARDSDGSISLDKVSQRETMLMIRTGDESRLSAPISFESISAQTVPLARSDIDANENIDAARVSLATAVRFIAGLQQRENEANGRKYSAGDGPLYPGLQHDDLSVLSADAWADEMMQQADEKGIDNHHETLYAIRRLKAAKRGEVFDKIEPDYIDSKWI